MNRRQEKKYAKKGWLYMTPSHRRDARRFWSLVRLLKKKGVTLSWLAGYCPVQGEGTLMTGERFYFRSRGTSWSLEITPRVPGFHATPTPWNHSAYHGPFPSAGYLTAHQALRYLYRALNLYWKEAAWSS